MTTKTTEPTNETQIKFLDLLIEGATVAQAAEACDYNKTYGYTLANKYRNYIIDRTKGLFYVNAVRAAEKLIGTMDVDGSSPSEKLNMEAALHVLDRIGITKQETSTVNVNAGGGVFFLPAKNFNKSLSDDESDTA